MATTTTVETEKKLQDELKESAHRIWLAGLGALAAAGEEGTKMFNRLVERGREYEAKGKDELKEQMDWAKGKAETAKTRVGDTWTEWGEKLDETLTSALHRLGVPTREEIQTLTRRVEELNAKVEALKPRVMPVAKV